MVCQIHGKIATRRRKEPIFRLVGPQAPRVIKLQLSYDVLAANFHTSPRRSALTLINNSAIYTGENKSQINMIKTRLIQDANLSRIKILRYKILVRDLSN